MTSPRRAILVTTVLAAAAAAAYPTAAGAYIGPTRVIDGPDGAVVGSVGGAIAQDGTGGVVWRRLDGGRPHVFASLLRGGTFSAPQRVDAGVPYDASQPRIAASNGGRLTVSWITEYGRSDRLYAAVLAPGGRLFAAPQVVDFAAGDGDLAQVSLAANRAGQALLAFRATLFAPGTGGVPDGYVGAEYRLARLVGGRWSKLGVLANRNPAVPVRAPAPGNGPQVDVDDAGNGVVAFQEPDDESIDRIWLRRVTGTRVSRPLVASPTTIDARPLRGGPDVFSVDVAADGSAAIALRQQPGSQSPLRGPRTFVTTLPPAKDANALVPVGPTFADGAGDGPPVPDTLSVATAAGSYLLAASSGTAAALTRGSGGAQPQPSALPTGGIAPAAVVGAADLDRSIVAWRTDVGGGQATIVQSDGSQSTTQAIGAAPGGPINELSLSTSRRGDGLATLDQGPDGAREVAAAIVDAPPADFAVSVPDRWQSASTVTLDWTAAPEAFGPVTYTVAVDGRTIARTQRTEVRVSSRVVRDGRHALTVTTRDPAGQAGPPAAGQLQVDRTAPTAAVAVAARIATVTVSDRPARGATASSGVPDQATRVDWGDGGPVGRSGPTATHQYARPGLYRLLIRSIDGAGNAYRRRATVTVAAPRTTSTKSRSATVR